MIRLGGLLLLAASLASPAYAQQTEAPLVPELRVTVTPEAAQTTNGYVQGQIVLSVQLLSRHPFESLSLDVPQIQSAEVIELMRPRTRKITSYAGEGYAFETSVAIIPRTSGVLTIPPVTAVGHVEPAKNDERPFDLASDSYDIKIAGISKYYRDPWWLVSDRVEIEESWSTPPEDIRVGEIVQRRVSVRVWGVPGERLPTLEHGRTTGMRVSLASAETKTEKGQGGLIGSAEYIWDLQAEPQQVTFIAPLGISFWDPVEHRARRAGVKGLRLEPLPVDRERAAAELMQEAENRRDTTTYLILTVAGLLVLPVLVFLASLLWANLPTRSDHRLRTALKGGDPRGHYTALQSWLVEHDWSTESFDRFSAVRRHLSDHLFGSRMSAAPGSQTVVADAMRFARRNRIRNLLARFSRKSR